MRSKIELPKTLRIDLVKLARKHRSEHQLDARQAAAAARFYASRLIPPKRPGRQRNQVTTHAVAVYQELAAIHADWTPSKIWQAVYTRLIPGYALLSTNDRKQAQAELRAKVNDRRRYERRHKPSTRNSESENRLSDSASLSTPPSGEKL